jgi:dephospho-CoA kinase
MSKPPFRVALTGGIASGKSTVAKLFARHGVPLIDTDVIAREVVEPGEPALAAIVAAFGPDVLGDDGRMDRSRMRERVFGDEDARKRLEGILHPAIRAEMERQSARASGPYQMLVIPLLVESGRKEHVDRVLVVDAPEELQIARLMCRDHVRREQALAALAAQTKRDARLDFADDVIVNDGDPEALSARVDALHREYLRLAAQR